MLPVLAVLFAICLAAAAILAIKKKRQDKPRSAKWLAALWTPERTTPHALRGKASGLRPMAAADWVVVEPAASERASTAVFHAQPRGFPHQVRAPVDP